MDTPQTSPLNETDDQRDIRLNKDMAAFGYIWILSIAVYASKRDSKFAQFHSKQGIVLFLFTIPIGFIPSVGQYLMLLPLAGMLLGFINAAQGQYRDVPIAGPLSRGEMKIGDLLNMIVDTLKKIIALLKNLFKNNSHPTPPSEPVSPSPTPIPNPNPNPNPNPHP